VSLPIVYRTVTAAVAPVLTLPDSHAAVPPFERDDAPVRALVSAAMAGDREAFGALITQHEAVVLRTAMAALGRREDAEEAAQDALIVAWKKLPGFRGEASFRTWLLTIVWRKALDRRRVRSLWWKRTQFAVGADEPELTSDLAGDSPTPERETLARDLAARTSVEINLLSPKLRDALLLAASGEHSYLEIAVLLGIPLGTVKWRVSEARRILTTRLEART
jgi:RNA polymerase sigma-70 factor (ECF subfamily)